MGSELLWTKKNYWEIYHLYFLLQETMEAKQILYIITNFTDDFDNSEIFIPLFPFLSSICLGWIEKFQEQGIILELPNIRDVNFVTMMKKIRIGVKLYSDNKFAKACNKLSNSAVERKRLLESNYNFYQEFFVYCFVQHDLGVLLLMIFLMETLVKWVYILRLNKFTTIEKWEQEIEPIFIDYSRDLSAFINSVTSNFEKDFNLDPAMKLDISSCKLRHIDKFLMDNRRQYILLGNLPLEVQLQLFNILCQNNFLNSLFTKVF